MHFIIRLISLLSMNIYAYRFIQNQLFKFSKIVTIDLRNNIKMKLVLGDLIPNYIYHFRIWEPNLTNYILSKKNELKQRSFIDIGANIGYYTILVGKSICCKTYSYEPTPYLNKQLLGNIKLNDITNVEVKQLAISNSNKKVKIYEGHKLNKGSAGISSKDKSGNFFQVESTTLKDELKKWEPPPKLIKIDTEGSEYLILHELGCLLDILPSDIEFIIEINPELIGFENANSILDTFVNNSFNAYELPNSYDIEFYIKKYFEGIKKLNYPIHTQKDILFKR